jgi:shikimate kinase
VRGRRPRRTEPPPRVRRIVLVGFMASGKSTVGRRLAGILGWDFLDFDEEIERRTGLPIPDIFRRMGEPAFRALEAELTAEYGHLDHIVLAPGGGWITQPGSLERLAPGTLVVWLRVSPEEAVRRAMRDRIHRPLLAGPDPLARARLLLSERESFYRQADVAVDVDGRDPDEVAAEIAGIARHYGARNPAGYEDDWDG